jgi:NAD(P)-dependent dehydrogenase (short-subunit alcohol dehydrogenase family)
MVAGWLPNNKSGVRLMEGYTLITGATSGFGRAIAEKLAPQRRLILAGRNPQKLEAVRNACSAPEQHLAWEHDLSTLEGISESLESYLLSQAICIDHFIHSAGILSIQYARSVDTAAAMRLFNVNLFSAMQIIRPLLKKRINQEALQSITFISSIASRVGAKGYSVYAASKGAVNGLSLSLAIELAPRVRVNAVLPGIVATEMNTEHFADDEFRESVLATHPMGFGSSEDVACTVEFLASAQARWITGQEIVVDGGRSIYSPLRAGDVHAKEMPAAAIPLR